MEELLEDWFPRGALVTGTCGEASGVLLYGGEEMGVTNLLVVARVKKSSSSFIVSLLCRVSRGWRLGTMLNPSKAETAHKIWSYTREYADLVVYLTRY